MVACIVVDVYRYGAEGGDFLLEGGEGVVVLAGGVLEGVMEMGVWGGGVMCVPFSLVGF